MAYLQITQIDDRAVRGILTNARGEYRIPLRVSGCGLTNFRQSAGAPKRLHLNPSRLHVRRKGVLVASVSDIRLTHGFGKLLLEGINTEDRLSPVVVEVARIKELWTDSFHAAESVWNLEI